MGLAEDIKAKGLELGFDVAGTTDAAPIDNRQFKLLADWVAFGYAGRMNYMRENLDKRANPAKLLKSARSVICVGLNYTPLSDRGTRDEGRETKDEGRETKDEGRETRDERRRTRDERRGRRDERRGRRDERRGTRDERRRRRDETGHLPSSSPMGRVANYAQYEDYHSFIKRQLRKLVDFISSVADGEHEFKICVDSVPLAERALAVRAGLGFIGKSHMLVNRKLGPQIFLGEIITSLKLQTDEPIADSCHICNKCIEACPTGALRADGQFDANKCISYLTIEYSQGGRLSAKRQVPADLAEKVGDWLFGCDECVLACPYQEEAPVCKNRQFKFYSDRAKLDLGRVLNLTEEVFEAEFADSPIKRLGLSLLKRNARICLSNITRHSI